MPIRIAGEAAYTLRKLSLRLFNLLVALALFFNSNVCSADVYIPMGPAAPGQIIAPRAAESPLMVPFGFVVPLTNSIYVQDTLGGITELDLDTGYQRWQSKDFVTAMAFSCGKIFVIKSFTVGTSVSYKLIGLNVNDEHKTILESQSLPLPQTLVLPCDDYERHIDWHTSIESGTLTVLWRLTKAGGNQAPLQQLFHFNTEPVEENGAFNVNLTSGAVQTIVFDKSLWQNLSALQEKLGKPASQRMTAMLEPETVQYAAIGDLLIYVVKSYPTQPTVGSAGLVIKRQLKARSEKSEHPLWEHDLPAIFIPAMRSF